MSKKSNPYNMPMTITINPVGSILFGFDKIIKQKY